LRIDYHGDAPYLYLANTFSNGWYMSILVLMWYLNSDGCNIYLWIKQ
jgi:hypothetical protein